MEDKANANVEDYPASRTKSASKAPGSVDKASRSPRMVSADLTKNLFVAVKELVNRGEKAQHLFLEVFLKWTMKRSHLGAEDGLILTSRNSFWKELLEL